MAQYNSINHNQVYSDQQYNESTGFISPVTGKKKTSNWIKFGIPVAVIVIAGAVVGGIFGSRAARNNDAESNSASGDEAASSASSVKGELGRFATATDSEFMVPIYPSTTNTAAFSNPTFISSNNPGLSWPEDPFQPSNPNVLTTRTDRPRLIAPAYKWAALPALIAADPYLQGWNDTIFANATDYLGRDPVAYVMDGDSGILDNAREVKMRIKAFAYAYRMSNDTKWVDRCWREVQNAGSSSFGPETDKWNQNHFLDVAEFSAAYAIAYDWLYDLWSEDQKSQMRDTLIRYGLNPGVAAYTNSEVPFGWWRNGITGNWNCVCNGGLTLASLAILGDDTTGTARQLLGLTVDNAKENCANAVSDDGTWKESAHYWYFGTTGHAEMSSALLTATGSHYGLLDANPNFSKTGNYHMHAYGPTSLFDWGDHGPTKFSTTANSMIFYSTQYNEPRYSLFQRDRSDAAEPWSMFWYDPSVAGAYWDDKELDGFFDSSIDQWAAMRSSWTDQDALYVGVKASRNQGWQTHNDLDVGSFVLDALGTRWAGELGSGDYRSIQYFTSEGEDAERWKYYRKMTEGQNTILINQRNQRVVDAAPTIQSSGSSQTKQGASTVLEVSDDSTAFWVADLTSAYNDATSVKRGVRMLSGRKQVLIQDEITASGSIQWRMHTNATVTPEGSTATLTRDGKTLKVSILNAPSGATFSTSEAKRMNSDVTPLSPDQENPGITVLIISLSAGTYNLQVLFTPQWEGSPNLATPPSVDLGNWSLESHN